MRNDTLPGLIVCCCRSAGGRPSLRLEHWIGVSPTSLYLTTAPWVHSGEQVHQVFLTSALDRLRWASRPGWFIPGALAPHIIYGTGCVREAFWNWWQEKESRRLASCLATTLTRNEGQFSISCTAVGAYFTDLGRGGYLVSRCAFVDTYQPCGSRCCLNLQVKSPVASYFDFLHKITPCFQGRHPEHLHKLLIICSFIHLSFLLHFALTRAFRSNAHSPKESQFRSPLHPEQSSESMVRV
jgi:hypothetical protein